MSVFQPVVFKEPADEEQGDDNQPFTVKLAFVFQTRPADFQQFACNHGFSFASRKTEASP